MSTKSKKVRPRKQSVVVELGTSSIKVAQFDRSGGGLTLSKLHLETFETFGDDLARRLATSIEAKGFARVPVIACLSRQMVNIRMLDLPSTEAAEIADMVDLQAGKQTPYSKDEILCDHRIIGSALTGYTRVMLVIVQRSLLRQQYTLLREAGLEVERMSVSSEGMINWFLNAAGARADDVQVLLDVDAAHTDFSVFSQGGLVFTRSIMAGADALSADKEAGGERLAREIQRSLDMAASAGVDRAKPSGIVLSGAQAGPEADALGQALGFDVRRIASVHPLAKKTLPPDLGGKEFKTVSVTALVGIALDPERLVFDLVPDVVRMRKVLHARSRRLTTFVALVLAAMMSASLFVSIRFFLQRNRLNRLRQAFEATQPVVERTERMREMVKMARARTDQRLSPLHLLSRIHEGVDGDLYFEVVDINRQAGRVSLSGSAGAARDIRSLVNRLAETGTFKTVRETGTTAKDARTGRFKFEVVCELETGS